MTELQKMSINIGLLLGIVAERTNTNIGSIVKSETAEVSLTDIAVESTDLIPCRERDGWVAVLDSELGQITREQTHELVKCGLVSHLIGGIGLDELTQIEVIVVNSLGQSF